MSESPTYSRFTPLYFRIQESIRADISAGRLKPNDRLPSEAELSAAFKTTRATVQRALQQLVFEGLVVRRSGSGSFVAVPTVASVIDTRTPHPFEIQVASHGKTVTYRVVSYEPQAATSELAARLSIAAGEEVWKLERLRLIDGTPVCLEERFFLGRLGANVGRAMLDTMSSHAFLSHLTGEIVPTIEVSVTAENASERVAHLLQIETGDAVLIRDNTHYASSGEALQWGLSIFRGDVQLNYVLGAPRPAARK